MRAESMWIAAWHQQTNGSERSHEAGLPQPPSRCGSLSAIRRTYQGLTVLTILRTATSGLLSQMSRWPLLKLSGADNSLAHC